jgi:hypothetical protein
LQVLVKGDNANVGQYSSNLTQSNPDASFTSSIGESSFIEQMSIIQKGFTPKTTPTKVFMPSIPRTPPIPRV